MDAHISFDLKEIDLKVRPGANPIKKIFNINLHYAGLGKPFWHGFLSVWPENNRQMSIKVAQ